MKVKVICRKEEDFTRERKADIQKVFRNLDPVLHPMEKAKEYTRALNAVKLDKVFAKPFVGALAGHVDSISCMSINPRHLNSLASGSMSGELRLWDIANKRTIMKYHGHEKPIRGLVISNEGNVLISCSDDSTVRLWQLPSPTMNEQDDKNSDQDPIATYQGKHAFRAIDHHYEQNLFVTVGSQVDVWNHDRSEPINSFSWGTDSIYSVKFNPSEKDIFCTTASDRSIAFYDLRIETPIRKLIMQTKTNAISWNPREAFNFTSANEDCNCYSYDMRNLNKAMFIHKGHVSAVMDIDYSPTGREFATGSYDRSVRIFENTSSKSREVFHTKRMQRVFSVKFSLDSTYIISGSDDTNIRLWKSKASEQLGILLPREIKKHRYNDAVKERYKHLPDIKRIEKHRHLPKPIYTAVKKRIQHEEAEKRKDENRTVHGGKEASSSSKDAKKRKIVAIME